MKRNVIKIIIFISSYFPLYVFLLILNFEKYNSIEKIKKFNVIIFLSCMLIAIVMSFASLAFIEFSDFGTKKIKIDTIERPDDTIISYMMTYVIPILAVNSLNEIVVNVFIFILIGYLYVRLNLLYLNPLWALFGFISYRANDDIILITNYTYTELKNMKKRDKEIQGFFISNEIFLAKKQAAAFSNYNTNHFIQL